jgi:hypothetical protein
MECKCFEMGRGPVQQLVMKLAVEQIESMRTPLKQFPWARTNGQFLYFLP